MNPYTTATFVVGGDVFTGVAYLYLDVWHVVLEKNEKLYAVVGFFDSVDEGWKAVQEMLGIEQRADVPRSNGEETDGGPIRRNDSYSVR